MQLRLDAADRLVELVEERRGAVPVEEAARALFALRHVPEGMARSLLDDVVRDDARLAWRGGCVALAVSDAERVPLEEASFCVVDLETTGLSPSRSRICEIGAARIERLELADTFQTLVNPRERLPLQIAALTGIDDRELRRAPSAALATRRFVAFAGDAVLVAHNARFDISFLDAAVLRLGDRRLAAPVVDTVWLARRVLAGRQARFGLASLAQFFGTGTRPCHRALPDAEATAEILLRLIGLAQERGARTVADLVELSAPRRRRVYGKRSLAFGAPTLPGVYLFRDAHGQVLYVGRARDLRARLRSYFRSERQRPSVEAALAAVESIEWRVVGSELEAALEELRLLRELRPPANARSTRPDRYVYLRARGDSVVVTQKPTPYGPLKSRRRAGLAARALEAHELERPRAALPRLRRKLAFARRRAALRGRGAAPGSHRRGRGSRRRARAAAAAARDRALPARSRRGEGLSSGVLRRLRTGRGNANDRIGRRARDRGGARRGAARGAVARARGCRRAARRRAVPPAAAARAPRRDLRRAVSPPRCISWKR